MDSFVGANEYRRFLSTFFAQYSRYFKQIEIYEICGGILLLQSLESEAVLGLPTWPQISRPSHQQ